jgi:hypothetical protein
MCNETIPLGYNIFYFKLKTQKSSLGCKFYYFKNCAMKNHQDTNLFYDQLLLLPLLPTFVVIYGLLEMCKHEKKITTKA